MPRTLAVVALCLFGLAGCSSPDQPDDGLSLVFQHYNLGDTWLWVRAVTNSTNGAFDFQTYPEAHAYLSGVCEPQQYLRGEPVCDLTGESGLRASERNVGFWVQCDEDTSGWLAFVSTEPIARPSEDQWSFYPNRGCTETFRALPDNGDLFERRP